MPLAQFPELNDYVGQDLIVTDGTSLLGADDKAGIAAIMHMLQYFKANPEIEHGPVKIGFVPDEEQGLRGAKAFDVEASARISLTRWIAAVSVSLFMKTGTQAMWLSPLPASLRTRCQPKAS